MKKIKVLTYLIVLGIVALLAKSCEKPGLPKGTPDCIKNKIEEAQSSCLEKVYRYEYNTKTVYFLIYPCPEGCYSLIDSNCNVIKDSTDNEVCSCNWGGAWCAEDFEKNRTNEKLIWEKE